MSDLNALTAVARDTGRLAAIVAALRVINEAMGRVSPGSPEWLALADVLTEIGELAND